MTPEEHIKAGNLDEALATAKEAVRSNPADSTSRIALFQIECVLGDWNKAGTQLGVLSDMDINTKLFAQIFSPLLDCELLRMEIFSGAKTPIVFGEPEPWMGHLIQATHLAGIGEFSSANELRAMAFELAPATPGFINDQPMEWIADGDTRLGPVLEVILDGCYRWVPFHRISSVTLEEPQDLRDLVWAPARFEWSNGGTASGFIPTRYSGSETSDSSRVLLSRTTVWNEKAPDLIFGLGQRQLVTNSSEFPLLEIRSISIPSEEPHA